MGIKREKMGINGGNKGEKTKALSQYILQRWFA